LNSEPYHTLIIGAGLAGLTAACHIARAGKRTLLVAEGIGAVALTTGCVDVLGFHPPDSRTPVARPLDALSGFLSAHPDHPYHRLGVAGVEAGLRAFARLAQEAGLDYRGDLRRNWLLPSPAGAVRPTALAPASMATGDLTRRGRILVVGFTELRDFYPALLCDTLNAQRLGVRAAPFVLDAPPPAGGRFDITPLQLAKAYGILGRGGRDLPVTILKREQPVEGKQLFDRRKVAQLTRMLETVVEKGGTAPAAAVDHYRVAGKTGTAHKATRGGYSKDAYVASFAGFAPSTNPRLVVAVMIDEPTNGKYFGGDVAGPVFRNVMAESLRLLNVRPQEGSTAPVIRQASIRLTRAGDDD